MLFENLVTPAEQRLGYLPVDEITQRFLASPAYKKDGVGDCHLVASVLIGEHRYDLEAWNDDVENGLFWSIGEVDAAGYALSLEDFEFEGGIFPLTVEALVQVIGTTFQLEPSEVSKNAVNLLQFWASEGIENFRMPSPEAAVRYRLVR